MIAEIRNTTVSPQAYCPPHHKMDVLLIPSPPYVYCVYIPEPKNPHQIDLYHI